MEKHRDAERKILYPAILEEFGEGFPPIQVMEAEHQEIERLFRGVAAGDGSVPALVRGFIDVLREPIAKEISVLFPMAEERIAEADLEAMASQCVEHRHQLAGEAPALPVRHDCSVTITSGARRPIMFSKQYVAVT